MRLNHVALVDQSFHLQKNRTVIVDGKRISAIGEDVPAIPADEETYDLTGLILVPGFIDMHIHGAAGADTSDGEVTALDKISTFLAKNGVTGFCPTTMMISDESLAKALSAAEKFSHSTQPGAKMLGVRLEGPYLSKEKCGVQNTDYAKIPSVDEFHTMLAPYADDLVRIVDLAPELPDAMPFIIALKDRYLFSIAHTTAGYDCCTKAISLGAKHGTHLFNAMNPMDHHDPGAVGALLDAPETTCELICDGMHLHPSVVRFAWKMLGANRVVVVSDAMRAAGMPDGEYDLGGKKVTVRNGRTDFGNGRLAGSTTNLRDEFKYLLSIGIPFTEALKACSINPARVLKIDQDTGSLAVGKYADMVAMDRNFRVRKVWVQGKLVYRSEEKKA